MFPAARITDPITHDLLIPSGLIAMPMMPGPLPTVFIEKMPRAVLGDFVMCSGVITGGIVHPPQLGPPPAFFPPLPFAPIAKGCGTVYMDKKPAGRWQIDMAACAVFLGDMKMAAMRTVFIKTPA